jgi:hypothetical protein
MSKRRTSSNSHRTFNFICTCVIAWIAYLGVRYATNHNMQMHTRREMQKIETQITSIYEDEIPNLHAKIDPLLIRYNMQEKLIAQGSTISDRPAASLHVIQLKQATSNTP